MDILKRGAAAGGLLAAVAWSSAVWAQGAPPAEDGLGDGIAQAAPAAPAPPPIEPAPGATISDAISGGKLLLEVRARYEDVEQAKTVVLRKDASAFTVRTRLGWETADWYGLKGLIEFEDVRHLGDERFAVNVPGVTTPPLNGAAKSVYPIINDPDVTELNRLQLTWTQSAALSLTAGRQRVLLDDQRFVGNVGWRQDEQTFDGLRADAAWGRLKGTYVYVSRVNRVLGELKDWNSDSHLLNATYAFSEALRLQGFVYALDFSSSPANNSITEGVKASGKAWLGLYQFTYNATYASQSDYRKGTPAFDLGYYSADLAGGFDIYTAKLAYEVLEGNGTRGFTTPLATTHAFNGWADAWVSPGGNKSFVDGVKDLNASLIVRPRFKFTRLFNSEFTVRYHDFNDQRTGADLAHEIDLQATAAITPKLTALIKYADFKRESSVPRGTAVPPADRTKLWFSLEYKL